MTIHPTARRAANLARLWPSLRHPYITATAWGIPPHILTLARVLACAERNQI